MNVDEKLIDKLADLEIHALIDCLEDDVLRYDPMVLSRARAFLKDNKLITNPTNDEMQKMQLLTRDLPNFIEADERFKC